MPVYRDSLSRRFLLAGAGAGLFNGASAQTPPRSGLSDIAARHGVLFGAAIEPDSVDRDPAFATLLARECASLTAENHMKWNMLRPGPGRFDFDGADRVLSIARRQAAMVHGHCLVWHEANPAWLIRELKTDNAQALLEGHIATVVGRYTGLIRSWDVVNEAIERNDRRPDGLRKSLWLNVLGPDYIPLAFEAAHRADPGARLLLSDYGLEYDDEPWMVEKRGTLLELLAGWKRSGVPIHALGIQGHLIGHRPASFGPAFRRFLRDVSSLGLGIDITELDVNDQNVHGSAAHRDRMVAQHYRAFLQVALSEPAVRAVTTWGLSDRYTSKSSMSARSDGAGVRPLPFDQSLQPKQAWFAMADAFAERQHPGQTRN